MTFCWLAVPGNYYLRLVSILVVKSMPCKIGKALNTRSRLGIRRDRAAVGMLHMYGVHTYLRSVECGPWTVESLMT